jgi:phosphoserine phosphatase
VVESDVNILDIAALAVIVREAGKVTRLKAWLDGHGRHVGQMSAYSDSHNDLPLLEMADRAVAVDPDPTLRAAALARGWEIISLR